jgi:hypothetical protein
MKMKKEKKRMAMEKREKTMMKKRRRRRKKNPWIQNQLLLNVFFSTETGLTIDAKNRLCPNEKHHFDTCAARVAKAEEEAEKGGEHHGHAEDCAEEFLHLMHCVDKKIAVPLFRQLK